MLTSTAASSTATDRSPTLAASCTGSRTTRRGESDERQHHDPGADVGSYEDIVAAAVRTTGLSDFGGTAHEEGLRVLTEDLARRRPG